jgi:uncharacterized protein (TIGR02466 family)
MITVQTVPLFQSSIAWTKIFGFEKLKLIQEIFKLENQTDGAHRSNAGGWQSTHYDMNGFDNLYAAELFREYIFPILDQVADSWGFPRTKNLAYWYNINRKYNYNHTHYHPLAILSGVLYLKVPTNSGKITFTRAGSEADRMDFLSAWQLETNQVIADNANTNVMHSKEPEENLLIIFPGHLEHYVEQNLTNDADDSRISVSFNYFLG